MNLIFYRLILYDTSICEWISMPVKWEPQGKTMLPKYKKEKNLVFQRFLVSPPPTK